MPWETEPLPQPDPKPALQEPPVDVAYARTLVIGIGCSISILSAGVLWWFDATFFAVILAGGAVAGPIVAWRRAAEMAGPRWAIASAKVAVEAVLLASAVLWAAWGASALLSMSGGLSVDLVAGALGLAVFVGFFGLATGLPFAMPVALLTGWLVRKLARRGSGLRLSAPSGPA